MKQHYNMGNVWGTSERPSDYDIELQEGASQQNTMTECDCVDAPDAQCLHWAIKERKSEYVS